MKDFRGKRTRSVSDQCKMGQYRKQKMRVKSLCSLINSQVRDSDDYLSIQIMNDLALELGLQLAYKQTWMARECIRTLQLGRPVDHYKLMSWLCSTIIRANPDSRAFCELEGVRSKCMFVACGVSLNGFIMGC